MQVGKSPKKKSCCIFIPACVVYGDITESPEMCTGWIWACFTFLLCMWDADWCHCAYDLYSRPSTRMRDNSLPYSFPVPLFSKACLMENILLRLSLQFVIFYCLDVTVAMAPCLAVFWSLVWHCSSVHSSIPPSSRWLYWLAWTG